MAKTKIFMIVILGACLFAYNNCSKVNFENTLSNSLSVVAEPVDCLAAADSSVICDLGGRSREIYFIGGLGQSTGNTLNAPDQTGDIILKNTDNLRHSRVRIFMYPDGGFEIRTSQGYYPWVCEDHNKPLLEASCYSPIRWYSSDGQQGFAKDTNGRAQAFQKNEKNEVYRRATPTNSDCSTANAGLYVTNMVLAPPDRFNKDGSAKKLVWVHNSQPNARVSQGGVIPDASVSCEFGGIFTELYAGTWPYPENSTHLKVYDISGKRYDGINEPFSWNDILIEDTPQQRNEAAKYKYFE